MSGKKDFVFSRNLFFPDWLSRQVQVFFGKCGTYVKPFRAANLDFANKKSIFDGKNCRFALFSQNYVNKQIYM
jgi:hypothetical protein